MHEEKDFMMQLIEENDAKLAPITAALDKYKNEQ